MLRSPSNPLKDRKANLSGAARRRPARRRPALELLEDRCLLSANQNFLFQTYQDLFHRNLDSGGQDYWSSLLDQGLTRYQVALEIQRTPENLVAVINDIYQTELNRAPDDSGFTFLSNALVAGAPIEAARAYVYGSPEYSQVNNLTTNTSYVDNLYHTIFNRTPAMAEEAGWVQLLGAGVSRAQVALDFLISAEGRTVQAQGYYQKFLHRAASPPEAASIVQLFQGGAIDQQVIAGILGSAEYFAIANAPATHFVVAVPQGTDPAGTPFTLGVAAENQYNNVVPDYTGTVHFTSTDHAATLPADFTFTAADQGVHTFDSSATTLVTAGTQTITATEVAPGTLTGTTRPITVTPLAAASFQIDGPSTVTAGTAFNVTVSARDQFGNVATGYTGPAHFVSTDSGATLPADYTFVAGDNGSHTFPVTFTTAGTQALGVEDNPTNPTLQGVKNNIQVNPATATHFVVSAPSGATAGSAFDVTVTALDQFNNVVTGYAGTVHFTSTDAGATLPANYTFVAGDQGAHTFSITLVKAGSQTVTAAQTGSGTPVTGTSGAIAVAPADADHFTISAPATATAGTAVNVTLTAFDHFGNVATGYAGTVHFTSTDGSAQLPGDTTFSDADQGTQTVSVTFLTAGQQTVTAMDTQSGATGTSGKVTVAPAAAVAFQVDAPDTVTAGTAFSVTVSARDQFGNVATGYTGPAHFVSTDSGATLPHDYTFVAGDNGVHTFSVTLTQAGTQTVGVEDNPTSPTLVGTSNNIQVNPAAASQFAVILPDTAVVGTPVDVQVEALDPFGNVATGFRGTVSFTSSDAAATLPADYPFVAGDAGSHTFPGGVTFNTVGDQTVTVKATVGGTTLTGTSSTVSVEDGM
jgi:hypothetical protein